MSDEFEAIKAELSAKVGDLSNIEIFNNQVLVAVFVRSEKTKSGIYRPDSVRAEDDYQSKLGLVLKMGATAGRDNGDGWFKDVEIHEKDWVIFRPSDGWGLKINQVMCRILEDVNIRGRVTGDPELVY